MAKVNIKDLAEKDVLLLVSQLDEIIELKKKSIQLHEELKRAYLYEYYEYSIKPNTTGDTWSVRKEPFFLWSKTRKSVLMGGTQKELEKYCFEKQLPYWLDLKK